MEAFLVMRFSFLKSTSQETYRTSDLGPVGSATGMCTTRVAGRSHQGRGPNLSTFIKYITSGRVAAPRASIGVERSRRNAFAPSFQLRRANSKALDSGRGVLVPDRDRSSPNLGRERKQELRAIDPR